MGKIAFTFGDTVFYTFGILISFAILVGLLITYWQSRKYKQNYESVLKLFCLSVPVGLIAARFYFFYIQGNHAQVSFFDVSQGGLSFIGAMPVLILLMFIYTKWSKLDFWHWLDMITPGLAIGQAVAAIASFISQDNVGYPTYTWGIYIDYENRPVGYEMFDYFFPVSLWLAGIMFSVFCLVLAVDYFQHKYDFNCPGSLFLLYSICYCTSIFYLESMRLKSEAFGALEITQLISGLGFLLAVITFVLRRKQKK